MVTRAYLLDLIERCVWTFLQAFFGVLVAAQTPGTLAEWKTLALAGAAAGAASVIAVVKGLAAGLKLGTASTSKAVAAVQTAGADGAHAEAVVSAEASSALDAASRLYPMASAPPVGM